MNFKKLILPLVIMVGAVTMAFTSISEPEHPKVAQDYILVGGSMQPIPEQNCSGTEFTCRVKFQNGGQEYEVYDESDDLEPKRSSSEDATLISQ